MFYLFLGYNIIMKILFIIFIFLPFLIKAEPTEEVRQKYAKQMYQAFELQSIGKSTLAFYTFRDAYQYALANGESAQKLIPFDTLFTWYRKYGYSSGVAVSPSGCTDEFRSAQSYEKKPYSSSFTPQQEKLTRDFLFGVGQVISGVFSIVINPPLLGRFGVPLVISGMKYIYDSVSSMIKDFREKTSRLKELEIFQKNAAAAAEKN